MGYVIHMYFTSCDYLLAGFCPSQIKDKNQCKTEQKGECE